MKIFISYPSEQLRCAKEIYDLLMMWKIQVWLDKKNLIAGQDWSRALKEAQRESDLTILICSNEIATKSGVIQREKLTRNPLDKPS